MLKRLHGTESFGVVLPRRDRGRGWWGGGGREKPVPFPQACEPCGQRLAGVRPPSRQVLQIAIIHIIRGRGWGGGGEGESLSLHCKPTDSHRVQRCMACPPPPPTPPPIHAAAHLFSKTTTTTCWMLLPAEATHANPRATAAVRSSTRLAPRPATILAWLKSQHADGGSTPPSLLHATYSSGRITLLEWH